MAESTRLCPVCHEIMQPVVYRTGDNYAEFERKIYKKTGNGFVAVSGKLCMCDKCGCLAVTKW
ncbi:hypothetical protein LG34_06120 [Eubacterium ramulus]|uniref:Uncharacterized protein n=1 Tax=Eubacterium ramulus TaxID=39490 RepID=A0A2V1JUB1_EUBRA|nr:hypothetical protein [Eubacterium ramulus]PWE87105.1 hypothetical protein LG34_06120 [Eubacterium ramulus]